MATWSNLNNPKTKTCTMQYVGDGTEKELNFGFKPDYIFIQVSNVNTVVYNAKMSTSKIYKCAYADYGEKDFGGYLTPTDTGCIIYGSQTNVLNITMTLVAGQFE